MKKLNQQTTNDVLDFLKNYKIDSWIYPGVLKRKFNLTIDEVYSILSDMENEGILQSYYELYCSHCQKSMGVVRLFNELPENFMCELCDEKLYTLENTILIYKVILDE